MQLSWYYVEEDCTLTKISSDQASELIAIDCLEWHVCGWPSCYIDSDTKMPVVVQGIMGLEGTMI